MAQMLPRDEAKGALEGRYANYLQVTFNDVEFIIEFGQDLESGPSVHTKIIVSPANVEGFLKLTAEAWASFESRYGPQARQH